MVSIRHNTMKMVNPYTVARALVGIGRLINCVWELSPPRDQKTKDLMMVDQVTLVEDEVAEAIIAGSQAIKKKEPHEH